MNEIVKLEDGWTVKRTGSGTGYWKSHCPDGIPVRTPGYLTKEDAVAEHPRERRLHDWENGIDAIARQETKDGD